MGGLSPAGCIDGDSHDDLGHAQLSQRSQPNTRKIGLIKMGQEEKTDDELRRSPRLQCSGLAGVQTLPACEKTCPAKIINLSIRGCLMELERPLTLVMDEIVGLIFCVNHTPFRVRGKVRTIRSETLMGFQFPQLSDRTRRQLEDLVGELIDHLARLHRESIANRPIQDDVKLPQVPAALTAHGTDIHHPMRHVDTRPDNVGFQPDPHGRWI